MVTPILAVDILFKKEIVCSHVIWPGAPTSYVPLVPYHPTQPPFCLNRHH